MINQFFCDRTTFSCHFKINYVPRNSDNDCPKRCKSEGSKVEFGTAVNLPWWACLVVPTREAPACPQKEIGTRRTQNQPLFLNPPNHGFQIYTHIHTHVYIEHSDALFFLFSIISLIYSFLWVARIYASDRTWVYVYACVPVSQFGIDRSRRRNGYSSHHHSSFISPRGCLARPRT